MSTHPILQTTPAGAARTLPGTRAVPTQRGHWREYLIEAWALGTFMVSATACTLLFEHPASPVRAALPDADLRRVLIGIAMGLTAIALIYSPWGQRSGAHMNPAVTLTFLRLGKVRAADALGYVVAQFLGGLGGVWLVYAIVGAALAHPAVQFAVTRPGASGPGIALAAELAISALLMFVVLGMSSRPRIARFTGMAAGLLVATYISLEAPLSGMSMNPARSFASAWPAQVWTSFWIYVIGPLAGMQLGAWLHRHLDVACVLPCAKLMHGAGQRCIHCGYEPSDRTGELA